MPLVYPNNINRAADYTCIVFVFVYSLGYSIGFGPASWVYGSEVWNWLFFLYDAYDSELHEVRDLHTD